MKIPFTKSNAGTESPSSLIAALVLVALVPAICVLWFMTVAMRNERLAVQERLKDVYLTHVASLQRQLTAFWQGRQTTLSTAGKDAPAELFAAVIRSNLADSVVVYDGAGKALYPSAIIQESRAEENGEWALARELEFQKNAPAAAAAAYARIAQASGDVHARARAMQSQASCLLKAGQKEPALKCLTDLAGDASLRAAVSAQGTLIVPNAQLLILKLVGTPVVGPALLSRRSPAEADAAGPSRDERDNRGGLPASGSPTGSLRQQTLDDLMRRLNDYADPGMASSQRRFLMREVNALAPDAATFPTLEAEELAADFMEREPVRPPEENILRAEPAVSTKTVGAALRRDDSDPSRRKAAPTTGRVEAGSEVSDPTSAKLQRTPLAKVWSLPSTDRTVVALFREDRLKAEVAALVGSLALPDFRVTLLAPGESFASNKPIAPQDAGEFLPGWRLGLSFKGDDPLVTASARQTRFYLGTGFVVVVVIALVALLVARYVAAQMRLARLKNELVSTVSHELKTPLASMRALVDTLAAGRYRDERQLRDYLDLIAKENVRLGHLIDNFLTFSRLERGRQQFRFEALEPARVVADAVEALKEKLEAAHCAFASQIEPGLPRIRGDADALSTVLINLLDNAYKYTDGEKRISARAYADGRQVCFEIADNGIGFERSEAKKIFDRFYQVDQSLTRQRGGCGLGLGIVQYIVRAHGGAVQVESEPGKGSTFRVTIPQATLNV